ncbi:MAG: DUF4920 domain-containing protein [Deltaproteobacteria bacterium]|nr:MAG: DUF4920 domain-containing protein [Deltaproteobacteria bacterium]
MSHLRLFCFVVLASCSSAPSAPAEPAPDVERAESAAQTEWATFGEHFTETEPTSLSDLLAQANEHLGSQVTVEGRISEVCQKAGCWLVVSEGDQHMRVRMKDHAFSVDKDGAGRVGLIQGELISREVDASEVAHYAEETREGGVVPEHTAQGPSYEIIASSVRLKKS